jgi:CRP-like cAMP-binding protein
LAPPDKSPCNFSPVPASVSRTPTGASPSPSEEVAGQFRPSPTLVLVALEPLRSFESAGSIVCVKPNEVLCQQGHIPEFVYLIESGWTKLCAVSSTGKETIVGLRTTGCIVDLASWALNKASLHSVVAASFCKVRRLASSNFASLIDSDPAAEHYVRSQLHAEALVATRQQVELKSYGAEERYLNLMAEIHNLQKAGLERILSQRELAQILDVTPEYLSRVRQHLRICDRKRKRQVLRSP